MPASTLPLKPTNRDSARRSSAARAQTLSPAELIELSGTSRGILRVYERCGLIAPLNRSQAGYRRYAPDTVEHLKAIRVAKDLGFSLAEIAEMLGIGAPGMTKAQVRGIAAQRVALIDDRISQLRALRDCFASYVEDPAQAFDPECDLLLSFVTQASQSKGNKS
jgi:DNA-binding transcriptional MerR regulator